MTSTRRGEGGQAQVDACGQGGKKRDFVVDVINGWPLSNKSPTAITRVYTWHGNMDFTWHNMYSYLAWWSAGNSI